MKACTVLILTQLLIAFLVSLPALANELFSEVPSNEVRLKAETDPEQQNNLLFRAFGFGMYIAAAGDAVSTEWSLSQPNHFERNPLMTNREVRLSSHVLAPAAGWWTTEWMRKKGHEKAALLLRIGITVGYSYLTLHNIRTAAHY